MNTVNAAHTTDTTESTGRPGPADAPGRSCPACGNLFNPRSTATLCPACLLSGALTDTPDDDPQEPSDPAQPVPERFGPFELFGEAGRGGMGIVYRARQRGVDRWIALKLLQAGRMLSPSGVERFQREAAAIARLDHPGILPLYSIGEHQGQPWCAVKWMDGGSLAQRLDEFRLPRPGESSSATPSTIARFVGKIALPIHHAHQRGVLHRDLKPGNILLDHADDPVVADFGLARTLDSDSALTRTGAFVGSPAYTAPELAASDGREVTVAAELYGLGAILYELLTGQPPFTGNDTFETLRHVVESAPTAPRALNPAVPRDLETICLKCIEKEPAKRYPTAQALADDLDRFLNHEPIHARPVTRLERAWRWCRRKPALAASFLLVLVLVLVLGIASPIAAYRIDTARQEAVQQARQARLNQYVADINLAYRSVEVRDIGRARHLLEAHSEPGTLDDFRGWEWDYLWAKTQSDAEFMLGEHPDSIRCAAYSPSGSLLASGDLAGNVKLWDLDSRTLLHSLRESRAVHSLAFLSETILATANQSGTVTFYDVAHRRILQTIHTGASVRAVAASPELQRLAWLLGPDGGERLALWEMTEAAPDTGLPGMTPIAELPGPDWHQTYIPMNALAFAPKRNELAAGYSDGRIRLYDATSGALRQTIEASDQVIATSAYSANGRWLASGAVATDTAARIWDAESGEQVALLSGHSRWISRVAFLANDTRLLTTSPDQTVRL